ncbi:MAG: hypothetical protein U0X76_04410 [Bacteroidia bacterium]
MNKIIKAFLAFVISCLLLQCTAYYFCSSHIHPNESRSIRRKQRHHLFSLMITEITTTGRRWYKMDTAAVYILKANQPGPGSVIRWKSKRRRLGSGVLKKIISHPPGDSLIHGAILAILRQHRFSVDRKSGRHNYQHLVAGFEVGSSPLLRIMGNLLIQW